jgi:UDP-2,3-diacylglucosamine hydrolase
MAHGRYLFIADRHLDHTSPAARAQFIGLLDHDARECSALYILGDLFETWIGDDDDDPAHTQVCDALRRLTAAGVAVFAQRGNRDFLLGEGFERRTGCRLLPDPALVEIGGVRVVITHGDLLCTADHRYQQFRSIARHAGVQRAYLRLPLATRRALARMARAGSHEHTRQARAAIMDVADDAVGALLRASHASLLIHGHTHRPGEHAVLVDGRQARRVVLGDWYGQGSALLLHADGRYETLRLARAGSTDSSDSTSSRV